MHSSGEFFGELSLIDGKAVPAAVVSTKNSLTVVSKKYFYSLILISKPKKGARKAAPYIVRPTA